MVVFQHLCNFFINITKALFMLKNINNVFFELYQLELENCSILSELIIKMGGDNKYYSSSRKFLSGYNVDYIKNFSKIFLADIEVLEINIIEIKSIISKIENIKIKNKLKQILNNKKNALKILKENYFKNHMIN